MSRRPTRPNNPETQRRMLHWFLLVGLTLLCGCASPAPTTINDKPPARPDRIDPISNTDPCAMRLHDICGGLLLYFAKHGDLPQQLTDMHDIPGLAGESPFICPVSGQPYTYNPAGLLAPERQERIIVYDARPSHSNMRWAVRIQEPAPGQPLVARVVALPESFFVLHPPR